MLKVGLTGGIGSGKSTVAALFAARGVPVIDTDVIARELTAPAGLAIGEIRTAFGDGVLQADGGLDRGALRRLIFSDANARRQLEAILHPRIRAQVEYTLGALQAPYALIVIPLLVETGSYRDVLDRVLVVDCPEALQIERVIARNGLSRGEVEAILAAQVSRAARLAAADDVIENIGSTDDLQAAVAALHARYLALSGAASP
ncbi:MAG: dephospho-CoA kinase [Thiobacillus sp.]